jgi:hypothetical protein
MMLARRGEARMGAAFADRRVGRDACRGIHSRWPRRSGNALTAAFILQVTPSIWSAHRTAHPTGVSRGTWVLILSELSCWVIFGVHKADPRLITLGLTGVVASVLMLFRIRRTREGQQLSVQGV